MEDSVLPHKNEFLLNLRNNNYSNETLESYERDLRAFERFIINNSLQFEKISKINISEYKGFLRSGKHLELFEKYNNKKEAENIGGTGLTEKSSLKPSKSDETTVEVLSSSSINRMLSSLRTYLRFLIEYDYVTPIAPDSIKLIKTEKKESQVAELSELIKLIEAPSSLEKLPIVALRNRAMLELLFSTGMRISELCNLNKEQLMFTNNDGKHIESGKIYILGKGKKQRFVYLTHRAKTHLQQYLEARKDDLPALFVPTRGTRAIRMTGKIVRVSTNYLQMKIVEYRRRLGIIVPTSAHSLRHGFATYLAESGANSAAIQVLLGHESLATTTRYVHASDKFAESTHTQFHPLPEDA